MKILYDHQIFSLQKYGGVSKYFCELIKNIPAEHTFNLSLLLTDNQYLKEEQAFFKKKNIPFDNKEFKGKSFLKRKVFLLNKQYSQRSISSNKYDLFHPTFYDNYFFNNIEKPYIITVHDLIVFKFKDRYSDTDSLRYQMKKIIKNASRIIAVSENTKKDIIDIFDTNPENIDVIYHGFNKPTNVNETNKFGKYILYVGKRAKYKNFETFISAISCLLIKDRDLNLICIGTSFTKEELAYLKMLNITQQVIALAVDEKTLNNLFSHALAFVYPSLYEGFGMPILEAFANNCPVCLSNASCFPEIAGDAGVYFDPYDHQSILEVVRKVVYDKTFRNQIINRGKKRLSDFSWKKTAEKTIISYKKVIGE